MTHTSRFQKPGDYRTFEIAGFSIILILGKDKQLRAFHNVCRHRAYAVAKKECGSSTVLGCRYHGWSYDTRGRLIKAPEFENVPGFDKKDNGLWEVRTEVREGMVFVNFDAGAEVAELDLEEAGEILRSWGIEKMKYIADEKTKGAINWKTLGLCVRVRSWQYTNSCRCFGQWSRPRGAVVVFEVATWPIWRIPKGLEDLKHYHYQAACIWGLGNLHGTA